MSSVQPVPLPREQIAVIVDEHLPRFAQVLGQAWVAYRNTGSHPGSRLAQIGPAARAMLISDFTREPARRVFGGVAGVRVEERYGRPWVSLAGGSVQVRFRALTPQLGFCLSDTDRAQRLAYHLGDPCLPMMEPGTVLTAGYVLAADDADVERCALVCHVGSEALYSIPLNRPGHGEVERPVQLPLTPLSPPLIRSSQTAAQRRLDSRADRRTRNE
ncbi:MAG: hypothetical protein QM711_16840 [Micropruina sp.]|uniref:hypothetical protein n=1 Tax=Micropruina sp. TaxID=2737536 RepID=UPI0039E67E21